jgi:hypothetical protein
MRKCFVFHGSRLTNCFCFKRSQAGQYNDIIILIMSIAISPISSALASKPVRVDDLDNYL